MAGMCRRRDDGGDERDKKEKKKEKKEKKEKVEKKEKKGKAEDGTDHPNPEIAEANRLRASLGLKPLR